MLLGCVAIRFLRRQGFGGLSVGFSSVEFLCVGLLRVLCDIFLAVWGRAAFPVWFSLL